MRTLASVHLPEFVDQFVQRAGIVRMHHDRRFRRGSQRGRDATTEILRHDRGPLAAGLRKYDDDEMAVAGDHVSDVVARPYTSGELGAESRQSGGAPPPRVLEWEPRRHDRDHRVVPVGPAAFPDYRIDRRPGVAESGRVVDGVVEGHLVEGLPESTGRPASDPPERAEPDDPGEDEPRQRREADELDGRPSHGHVPGCGGHPGEQPRGPSEEEERDEDRREEERGGHLDRIDAPQDHRDGDEPEHDQAGEEEKIPGTPVAERVAHRGEGTGRGSLFPGSLTPPIRAGTLSGVSPFLSARVAFVALFSVFLIPIGLSSLRGLSHSITCSEAVETPFQVLLFPDAPPIVTGSSVVAPGGGTLCGGLGVDISVRVLSDGRVEVEIPLANTTSADWFGTVQLEVAGTRIPVDLGKVEAGDTRAERIALRLPEGTTEFDGSLLVGP